MDIVISIKEETQGSTKKMDICSCVYTFIQFTYNIKCNQEKDAAFNVWNNWTTTCKKNENKL